MDKPIKSVPAVRSTQGCWTCRLRRKKCDEVRPECLRCASVNVACCYGPKPEWIGNSALAKDELARIKAVVGASANRKRAAFRARARVSSEASTQYSPSSQSVPKNQEQSLLLPSFSEISSGVRPHDRGYWNANETKSFWYPKWVEDHEASLMMHYLDNVFFLQFRFHTPSLSAGGRGWLLSLLTRTKPLYHAALSLSALHQQSLLCLGQDQAQMDTFHELERHHNLTLQELQLFIRAQSENASEQGRFKGNIQILACMVELISFELFNGGISNWQVHLAAASTLILSLHGISQNDQNDPEVPHEPRRSLVRYASQDSTSRAMSSEHAALEFLTGAVIWFDILACVSTGARPYLSDYHTDFLTATPWNRDIRENGVIELDTIMGCRNWVMVLIGRIAQLGQQQSLRAFSDQQVREQQTMIRDELSLKDAQIQSDIDSMRSRHDGPPPAYSPEEYKRYTTDVVTHIFACAADVYLGNIVGSIGIDCQMEPIISALKMIPDPRMMRGLVWPLCVAGCMAKTPSEQAYFRSVTSVAVNDSRTFGNSKQALEILEKAWDMQLRTEPSVDCTTCIREMGTCVLLV
ncbi:hypothetical protein PVAG01_06912 [Phlyctema vagabunda]|uniref:Zn(2)-C6 fungal-type domain-containing protein n=1 Tax=Phlyctema vagabunda TaxID=108571 RepID=A0ABR4PHE8_9HELO